MNEFELKFEVPAASLNKLATAMQAKKAQLQLLQACYFDTQDQALAKHGVVIRLRREDTIWVQTIKASTNNALERLEHNLIIKNNLTIEHSPNANNTAMPSIDLTQNIPKNIKQLLESILKINLNNHSPALVPVYETDVHRLRFNLVHANSTIEIALDQGMIESNGKSVAICELEFELKEGKPEHVIAIARKWRAYYGLHISIISKSMKGQRLYSDGEVRSLQAIDIVDAKHKPPQHANALIKTVFSSCINQILANASELANIANNKTYNKLPDHILLDKTQAKITQEILCIHQLRVAIRRLRVALREFKSLAVGVNLAWEKPLIDVFRELGKRRDADHLTGQLQPEMIKNGSPTFKLQSKNSKAIDVGVVVRAEKFQDVLMCLIGFVNSQKLNVQADKDNANDAKVSKYLKKRLNHWYDKSVAKGKKFVSLTQTQQHDVRKDFKKLRYLSEFLIPNFANSAKTRQRSQDFEASLKPVQDALGFYNDELVALETYQSLAKSEPKALYNVGWLNAKREMNAEKCQHAIDEFTKKTSDKKLFWQMD